MTKKFIFLTLTGIFIIYGCSQKSQEKANTETYSGESFMISDTVSNAKCSQSGGKIDQRICFCPANHRKDSNGFCVLDQ